MFEYTVHVLTMPVGSRPFKVVADSFKVVGDTMIFLLGKHPDTKQVAAFPTTSVVTSVYLGDNSLDFID